MDRILIDTNFLLDCIVDGRPGSESALKLFDLVSQGNIDAIVSPTSLNDFYYITRKDVSERNRRDFISLFIDVFVVADIGRLICETALLSDEPDFEDGILRAIAEAEDCTCIISRDLRAFKGSKVSRMTAEEYLETPPNQAAPATSAK